MVHNTVTCLKKKKEKFLFYCFLHSFIFFVLYHLRINKIKINKKLRKENTKKINKNWKVKCF